MLELELMLRKFEMDVELVFELEFVPIRQYRHDRHVVLVFVLVLELVLVLLGLIVFVVRWLCLHEVQSDD